MKIINRDTDYVIRALVYMAKRPGTIVCVDELVEKLKIPKAFLRRLLQTLSQKKVLNSLKGRGGGFTLNRPANKIALIELVKIVQGDVATVECVLKKHICPDYKRCLLRRELVRIQYQIVRSLNRITIASLTNEVKG